MGRAEPWNLTYMAIGNEVPPVLPSQLPGKHFMTTVPYGHLMAFQDACTPERPSWLQTVCSKAGSEGDHASLQGSAEQFVLL